MASQEHGREESRCSVCGRLVQLDMTLTPDNMTCPNCGVIVWFASMHLGMRVRLKKGEFEDFSGRIVAVDKKRGTADVRVEVLGRTTHVDVSTTEVEFLK